MKLEKREISLNEHDSLQDALSTETALLHEYINTLLQSHRKQVRGELITMLQEICQDALTVQDLLRRTKKE